MADANKLAPIQITINPEDIRAAVQQQAGGGVKPLTGTEVGSLFGGGQQNIPTLDRERAARIGEAGFGIQTGFGFAQPTGATDPLSLESLAQVGAAGAIGLLGGGPVGAVAAVATSGLSAFLNARAEKRRQKQFKRLRADAEKARKEQIAREDKWAKTNRLDRLGTERFNRTQTLMQNQWQNFEFVNKQMLNLVNNNASLKERFAKTGF